MKFRDIKMLTRDGNWACHYCVDYAIKTIDEWVTEYGLNLEPDFQRLHVWTESQQVAWLEHFLRGGKSGRVIYFNEPNWQRIKDFGDFVLVDGKQRLHAVRRFLNDEIKVLGGYRSEYEDRFDQCIHTLIFNVNTLPNRAAVLRWYIEMNAGGTPHTEQEIEKARLLLKAEKENQ